MNLLNQIKNSPELKVEWEKLLGAPLINEVLEQPVMTAIWEAVCKDWHTEDKETSEFYNFSEAGTDAPGWASGLSFCPPAVLGLYWRCTWVILGVYRRCTGAVRGFLGICPPQFVCLILFCYCSLPLFLIL